MVCLMEVFQWTCAVFVVLIVFWFLFIVPLDFK